MSELDEPRTGNLLEAADLIEVSQVTMREMVRKHAGDADDPLPILEHGSNGRAYVIDLDALAAWYKRHKAAVDDARAARSEDLAQMRLELFGADPDADGRELSAAEREKEYQAELTRIKLGRERGELVRAAEVEACVGDAFAALGKELAQLPDDIMRRFALDRADLAPLRKMVDGALENCAARLADEKTYARRAA